LYDLNDDGISEIISFISHMELIGAKDSGALVVFMRDGNEIISEAWLPSFPLDTGTLESPNSRQIGIERTETAWDNLFVRWERLDYGRSWNLENYIFCINEQKQRGF
jgi:hypothetical protein